MRSPIKNHDKLYPMRRMKSFQELAADGGANSGRFINLRSNRDLTRVPIKCRKSGDEGKSCGRYCVSTFSKNTYKKLA